MLGSLVGVGGLTGQTAAVARGDSIKPDSVSAVPGARYARGWFYRQLFGNRYRTAWATPIQVPVLDLATYAGGLKPTKKGGGKQTRSLRLEGADGHQYVFRSVDKDPIPAIDPWLRSTLVEELFQDQISASHPTAPLAVSPILRAVGVLHVEPSLLFLPDQPELGEFREEFANMLGTLEERVEDPVEGEAGFADVERIVDSDKLYEALEKHPEVKVSSRDFLTARLTDVFLGDWDRHRGQWQWALRSDSGSTRWLPLPRDRDQAFIRFDGFLLGLVRGRRPELVEFGPKYPPIIGVTWNGRDLDRRLLTELERPTWDSIATLLEHRITDSVIDAAVAALPPEHQRVTGAALAAALRSRRDNLQVMAAKYYEFLAGEVDVFGSDQPDVATVERIDAHAVLVEVRLVGHERPYYHRRFVSPETREVRIYLQSGSDSAVVRGTGTAPIAVRVVGGDGDDQFAKVSTSGTTGFYDVAGDDRSVGAKIDRRPFDAYGDTTGIENALPRRDWGSGAGFFPIASFHSNRGSLLGVGYRSTRYSFRRIPYASQMEYRAEVGFGLGSGRLQFEWRRPWENARTLSQVHAMVSGVDIAPWYGFGNETSNDLSRPRDYYVLSPYQVEVDGGVRWGLTPNLTVLTGVVAKYIITNVDRTAIANRFIAVDRPFGTGGMGQVGARVNLRFLTRAENHPLASTLRAEVDLTGYPGIWDLPRAIGSVKGRLAGSFTVPVPLRPTVALEVGGQRVFGTAGKIPFYEAAFVGGWETLRGYKTNRFAGDAAVYGSAELRLQLASLPLVVPGRQGIFGFYDRGRVYLSDESSNVWHSGWGGGIWLSAQRSPTILSLAAGRSVEGTRLYLRLGFAY